MRFGFRSRLNPVRNLISDTFNRTVNDAGVASSNGVEWFPLVGTWTTNGSAPATPTPAANNPICIIPVEYTNVDCQVNAGPGDCLYFRVKDAINWWRIRFDAYQQTSCQTCCSTCCSTCYQSCPGQGCNDPVAPCQSGSCFVCNSCYNCSLSCNPYSCNCVSCNCSSCNCSTGTYYRVTLEKSLSGTVTAITSTTFAGPTTVLRAVTNGSTVTAYYGTTTQFYSGTQTDLQTATWYGFGRGSTSIDSTALDNFSLTANG